MKSQVSTHFLPDPAPSRAMRSIPKASQGHFVGEFVFGTSKPQRVGFESLLEFQTAMCTVYRPGFVDLEEQLAPVAFRKSNGKIGYHFLDFRATFQSGVRIGMAVKPSSKAGIAAFNAKMRAIKEVATTTAVDKLVVVTERHIDPVELANAKLFHAARRTVPEEDDVVAEIVRHLRLPVRIEHIVRTGRSDGVTLFGVARFIHRGGLNLLEKEKINVGTMVVANDRGALS